MFFGIYGFKFKTPIHGDGYTLMPLSNNNSEKATNRRSFHLTGYMEIQSTDNIHKIEEIIFNVSSILTFIQQQHVIITYNSYESIDSLGKQEQELNIFASREHGSELVLEDSKELLCNLLMDKLHNEDFLKSTGFSEAFFRDVEVWRLNKQFMEITYYLCFSGIEILARRKFNDARLPVVQIITNFLKPLGFDVTQDDMQNYAHVRNALFHSGEFSKTINQNGSEIKLDLSEFENSIIGFFPDILLKIIGFNDNRINWKRWKDLQSFVSN